MKITLTPQQKRQLEQMHDSNRDGRVRDRIKTVLLTSESWSQTMISQALRIHESTVARHLSDYVLSEKLKHENGGRQSKLSATQTIRLIEHLTENTYSHTHQIVVYVKKAFGLSYTVSGICQVEIKEMISNPTERLKTAQSGCILTSMENMTNMTYAPVKDVLSGKLAVDSEVTVKGWIRSRRDSKAGISFLAIYDGSCFDPIQAVVPNNLNNYEDEVLKLTTGCSVEVTGKIVESPAKGQDFELAATGVKVVGWVEDAETYPMAKTRHSIEYLREVAHLRPRTNVIGAVARVRNCLSQAIHRFYHEQGYFWVSAPLITASDAEGAGEMFRVSTLEMENLPRTEKGDVDFHEDFFGKETFLTVSGQLNAEAYACALSKVYTFGPTFRAENSNTSRHLAEFWMVEPEVAFADLEDIAKLAEDMLKYVFEAVLAECRDDLEFFAQRIDKEAITRLEQFVASDFAQVDYTDAIQILLDSGREFEFPVEWGIDMFSEHERFLAEEHFKAPVIVKNYPKDIKAFYMRSNEDGKTVAAMDVLAPGIGEIIGGAQREERLDVLDARMREMGIDPEHISWYRDLRKYGTVPHAGFGLGFERLVSYVTGMGNVRDVIPFPRTPRSANF